MSTSDDRTLRVWEPPVSASVGWTCRTVLGGYHTQPVYAAAWSSDGALLASAGGDNSVVVFNVSIFLLMFIDRAVCK